MSTRSYIGKVENDGSVRYIYCHSDGYMSHNGVLLFFFYSDPKKLDKLLHEGDVSSLGAEIGKKHGWDQHSWNEDSGIPVTWSKFYARERGDAMRRWSHPSEQEFWAKSDEIPYLFKDGEWYSEDSGWPKTPENTVKFSLRDHLGKCMVKCSYDGGTIGLSDIAFYEITDPEDYEEGEKSEYEVAVEEAPHGSIFLKDIFDFCEKERVKPRWSGNYNDIHMTLPKKAMTKFVLLHC
jgi:hypothetical protein